MHAPVPKLPALPSPQRSRSRRERRSDAARKPVVHVVMPGMEVARAEIKPRETIAAFLRRTGWATKDKVYGWQFKKGLPTVLEVNGESVLRKNWRTTRIAANDNVRFVSFPMGGGSNGTKQIIGLVALIAVSAFALWAGPALFGAGTIGAFATTAAIGIGGSLLINALVGPKAGATNAPNATQDQIYSVAAQGNTAKLGQPLPVWYGRLKTFPDFAATPWGEFVGNNQYLNVLLSVGMGSFSYENLYIDNTILWDPINGVSASFPGAQVAFYEPGATVTLFPTNVDSSIEVSGQQLPDGGGVEAGRYYPGQFPTSFGAPLGPFVANPSGTLAQSIAIDFVFPGGCFTIDNNTNQIGYANVTLLAEAAPCDGAGAPTGSFFTLFQVTRQFASTSPIRDSIKTDVSPGRYLVRLSRLGANATGISGTNTVIWAGLRSFLQGANSFPDVSTVAIRLLASQSTQGSYKFGVLATRKLPVWNGSAFVTQATRNPAWAFYDAVTNSQYGSGLPISKTDFNAVVNLAAGATSRGDTFDYVFSAAVAVPAAFDKILTATRSRHFWLGDTVSVVRDEWRDVPSMMLTDREIVRDSTQVTWTMLGDEDPDAVIIEYIDDNTWLPAQVQYPPNDQFFTASHAEVKRIDGIVDRNQAFRECAFYYLQSIYRRENVQIGTEYEGRAITFGSVLRLQSELPMAYGYAGAVVGVSGNALTLDPAPTWDVGPFYIRLRQPNGKYFGPILATQGANAAIANLDPTSLAAAQTAQSTTLAAVLLREAGGEDPSFEFGTANSESKLCVVLNGVPNGNLCTLNLVVDDIRVHATSLGNPPILPVGQFPSNPSLPLIVGLNALFGQGTAEPQLSASWFPTAGAVYYVADASYDSGASWQQVYQGQDNKFTAVVTLAALRLRVQAVLASGLHGPYSTVDLAAPSIVISSQTVALNSLIAGLKYQVTTLQDLLNDKIDKVTQQIASIVSNQDTRNWLDKKEVRSQLSSVFGAANASITSVQQTQVNDELAFATFQTTVSATFGPSFSSVNTVSSAVATLNGYAAAQYAVTLNVNGYATGFNLVNGGAGVSTFTIVADKFQIQLPGYNGNAPKPFFTTGVISGVPSVGISGNMYLDGAITARVLNVGSLSAISANMGTITAGLMQSPDGHFVVDLTNRRLTISDNT
ncbi:protein of unknown function [Bradyrhizobium lablabi]|uniref:Tip attachment protein J domain-containing protein n=1 Tax=Bradyrhizobium lablabi TaxID=722472 RepID=A0A1M6LET8_9BRAD|nr:host specificity factor TipJ family phage tail protein [Bradyrhizobium lablabi]SHJ69729.1 protein of unknown function [Bradyrhizobium lablabi]